MYDLLDRCGCCEKKVYHRECICERTPTCMAGGYCIAHCPCDDCAEIRNGNYN